MEKLLTPEEVKEILNVKLSTIYQWTHLGFIPHIKVGRFLRFEQSEIEKWLRKKKISDIINKIPEQ